MLHKEAKILLGLHQTIRTQQCFLSKAAHPHLSCLYIARLSAIEGEKRPWLMSRNLLKTELTILERQFPRTHGVFQMISTSSEELVCQFTDIKQKKHTFQCNLSVCINNSISVLNFISLLVSLAELSQNITLMDIRFRPPVRHGPG